MKRLGVFGGTFDPIHVGHLALAEAARAAFDLERVLFVPVRMPPHKPAGPVALPEHRLAMVRLATAGNPAFQVSEVEVARPGPSYSVETLEVLHRRHPEAELYFVVGADEILSLQGWRKPERILELGHFIAAARPGFDLSRLGEALAFLPEAARQRVHVLDWLQLDLSASRLRELLGLGRSVRYLVPDRVINYIQSNQLYGRQP